jgi:uncharacterized protein (DUF2267 family)
MSAVGLESIDHTVQLTHVWINELDTRLGWYDKHRSYRLLRTVLQTLRDWLRVDEAASLGAQLPELLRGVYYEHWRPATMPAKKRSKADFIARIDPVVKPDPFTATTDAVRAVFALLSEKISAGEIAKVHHALPGDIRELWQLPAQAALTS